MTTVLESVRRWRLDRAGQCRAGVTLGLVPTMGALHDGHLSLVRRSRAENDRTLVSIFVNATQFENATDLAAYPRTYDSDLDMLRREGVDFVFVPSHSELYPDNYCYRVTENMLSTVLEGARRPGHFEGVLTVVLKLLLIASADRAYFGEKDWQQLALVRGMAQAFFIQTTIVSCPTIRAADGLALSSRNVRLGPADRQKAPEFHRLLSSAPSADVADRALRAAGFLVEYVEDRDGRRLGAVRLGDVRLIDNVAIGGRG
jgi:pantoate--beta-alanine ligase